MTSATETTRQYGGLTGEQRIGYTASSAQYRRRATDLADRYEQEDNIQRRARGLGWFSIGLGLAEIAAPRAVARLIGISDDEEIRNTMFALGVREITSGIGILSNSRPTGWVWSRVGGDLMDLALLGKAMNQDENDRQRLGVATAAVLGVTVLDFMTGQQLTRGNNGGSQHGTRSRNGTAGRQQGVQVSEAITINRPRDEVYGFWHNFENLPSFMAHLESVQVTGQGRSHWKAKAPAGSTVEWDAEISEDRPNELIAWRALSDAEIPNSGSVRFVDAPANRGTEVRVDLQYQPPGGKLGSWVAKLFGEEPAQQVKSDLRRFKQVMELGEIVHSDASIHSGPHPAYPPEDLADVQLLGNRQSTAS